MVERSTWTAPAAPERSSGLALHRPEHRIVERSTWAPNAVVAGSDRVFRTKESLKGRDAGFR